jgi:UDP-3-O-acyl N-acetylglucosamine deacetylase
MGAWQKTIKEEVRFSGRSLQSGRKAGMVCRPARSGTGIIFRRADLPGIPEIRLSDAPFSSGTGRRSAIGLGKVQVQTIEHFMASLWALGIDDLEVEIRGAELPAMDGSAMGFFAPLKKTGTVDQNTPKEYIRIARPIEAGDGQNRISIEPSESLSVSYLIDYAVPCIEKERFSIELNMDSFEKEIAPARTFCMKREALLLLLSGMGRGATFNNTLVLGDKGPVGTRFRFSNEPVRHKVLDLVGDLYMLGKPVLGKVTAERSGHRLNAILVRKIYEEYLKDKT